MTKNETIEEIIRLQQIGTEQHKFRRPATFKDLLKLDYKGLTTIYKLTLKVLEG